MKKYVYLLCLLLFTSANGYAQQIGEGYAAGITNANVPRLSGVYELYDDPSAPEDNSNPWKHLLVMRHSNRGNNYQLQLCSSYSNTDRLFFRKIGTPSLSESNTQWHELATRGSNTFSGTQTVHGVLYLPHLEINDYGYTSRIQWRGHSLTLGTPPGEYWYNSLDLIPGGANEGFLHSTLKLFVAPQINQKELKVQIASFGSSFFNGGNVGIGTTNPDQLLTVKGKIHAEEVLVDLNVPLADYVFKPGYPLMELSELEQFVKTNSHLPNIPTASQVVENGLSLGEMQNKLLQKVEELTLYVIEQNKKIEAQQHEINTLKSTLTQQP